MKHLCENHKNGNHPNDNIVTIVKYRRHSRLIYCLISSITTILVTEDDLKLLKVTYIEKGSSVVVTNNPYLGMDQQQLVIGKR